jgi:hypothetical protein
VRYQGFLKNLYKKGLSRQTRRIVAWILDILIPTPTLNITFGFINITYRIVLQQKPCQNGDKFIFRCISIGYMDWGKIRHPRNWGK